MSKPSERLVEAVETAAKHLDTIIPEWWQPGVTYPRRIDMTHGGFTAKRSGECGCIGAQLDAHLPGVNEGNYWDFRDDHPEPELVALDQPSYCTDWPSYEDWERHAGPLFSREIMKRRRAAKEGT